MRIPQPVALAILLSTLTAIGQVGSATSTARVIESKLVYPCFQTGVTISCNRELQVKAVIDGKTYWMAAKSAKDGLLELGTYPVEPSRNEQNANHKYWRAYRLKYPNGTNEEFVVVGEIL